MAYLSIQFLLMTLLIKSGAEVRCLMQNRNDESFFRSSKAFEGSSENVHMMYHMGPVMSSSIHIYIIWYGNWNAEDKLVIRDFLHSISSNSVASPSLHQWWNTVCLYADQTGKNVSNSVTIAKEHDAHNIHDKELTRLSIQTVIRDSLFQNNGTGTLPANSDGGVYLVLTAEDINVQDFCRAVCGFHYFTFPSIVGYTLPYAWVGNSGKQCPDVCAYPFVVPPYMPNTKPMRAPNRNTGIDGMLSVIGHELAELSSNPLSNAWFAGDSTATTEMADLCEGIYGSGGGGGYTGSVLKDTSGSDYNMNGIEGRKFLVQWLWSPVLNACVGPNAKS